MFNMKSLTRKQKFCLLALIPSYFVIAGFFIQPLSKIGPGILRIIREPDFLITDYFLVGGIGAALVNAGVLTLLILALVYYLRMEMDGHTITSCCLMFGFSLFGKNLLNIWTIIFGVFLYSRYHKKPLSNYIYVGIYGTSLSPIITQIMNIVDLPFLIRLILSIAVGSIIGFVLPPLSTHVHYAHKGYSLYNVGFASGIIATIIVSLFKSFGITTEARLIWSTGNNLLFLYLLGLLFGGMVTLALWIDGKNVLISYKRILKSTGIAGTDYLKDEGGFAVIFNMGINGIAAMLFVVLVGGDLNGPTIGGIFTIVGFSATGKHLRNIVPIMLGVYLASFTKMWSIYEPSPMLAFLFSTTLAPIAGEFGILVGILAGFLHSSVALNVGLVYGGMNLYNNGFAGGIVAIFLVPVIQSIRDRRARAKGEISL
ncbi:MAG: DUF1576 domain-containing protein [Clostridium sp.]